MTKYEAEVYKLEQTYDNLKYFDNIRKSLTEKVGILENDLIELQRNKTRLLALQDKMNQVSIAYKEERQKYLQEISNEYLAKIFPDDNFCVKFVPSVYRNKEYIDLYSGHNEGGMSPLEMQHGRLFRQFLGYIITVVIQKAKNCELLIMDEAMNSGDEETLMKITPVVKDLLNSGKQMIMIEHKHVLYENLPRLQYKLERDILDNSVNIVSETRY